MVLEKFVEDGGLAQVVFARKVDVSHLLVDQMSRRKKIVSSEADPCEIEKES